MVQQAAPPYLTFLAGQDLALGNAVYISADGTVSKTTGIQGFVGIVVAGNKGMKSGTLVTVACGKSKVRALAYGTITAGDTIVSGPGGTIQTLADVAAGDVSTSAGTALAINNSKQRRAVCDTGASSGGLAVIIL